MAHEQRTFSERTAQVIDEEIAKILHTAADRAAELLTENKEKLEVLANALLEREALDSEDMAQLIGPAVRHNRNAVQVPI
jgi:cell division protease FtsH